MLSRRPRRRGRLDVDRTSPDIPEPRQLLPAYLLRDDVAADRHGLSFCHHDRICSTLEMTLDKYLLARDGLIAMDLIAFDGSRFQVLSLPHGPVVQPRRPLLTQQDLEDNDPATIRQLLVRELGARR